MHVKHSFAFSGLDIKHYFGLHAHLACGSQNLRALPKFSLAQPIFLQALWSLCILLESKYMPRLKNHLPSWAHNLKSLCALGPGPWDKIYVPRACGQALMSSSAFAMGDVECFTVFPPAHFWAGEMGLVLYMFRLWSSPWPVPNVDCFTVSPQVQLLTHSHIHFVFG